VETGETPVTDGEEGLRVLRVLAACQKSMETGGAVVTLDRAPAPSKPAAQPYFAHQTAALDDGVEIGEGTKIWHFSHILKNSIVGKNCNIGQNVVIGPDVTVGDGCKIQNNVSVYKGVTLENNVFCGPSMVFTNVYNPRANIKRMDELRPTLVREGATIGANSTIMCGITLGRYCLVAAGAMVLRDVPDHALVAGNPATQKGWMCQCCVRLTGAGKKLKCPSCGRKYKLAKAGLEPAE
jgi:UDP-2-acetamido-3-amino-2,3-dideoxy-glucuronate N-acetyltransferase